MAQRTITLDEAKFAALEKSLRDFPKGIEKVESRAINKVATKSRQIISLEVRKRLNIPAGELKRRNLTLKRASYSLPVATIGVKGGRIPLVKFKANQTQRGVTYKIAKTGPRKLAAGSFIATMPSGHRGVFKRMTAENDDRSKGTGAFVPNTASNYDPSKARRLPIIELKGPSVPQVFQDIAKFAKSIHERQIGIDLERELAIQVEVLIAQGRIA